MAKTITKIVKTANSQASEKLQKAGVNVIAVTGGHLLQPKEYYFHIEVSKGLEKEEGEKAVFLTLRELKNKQGQSVLDENEIIDFVEMQEVGKTTFPKTGIKEKLK